MRRGILVAVAHCALVLCLAGKYALDRERLPRVWVETVPIDPNMPLRGRYISLALLAEAPSVAERSRWSVPARLSIVNGKLVAEESAVHSEVNLLPHRGTQRRLAQPVAFFIPERMADPSRVGPGEQLWVEVSVPGFGMPRPLRLGRKKDGVLRPFDTR